jgi:hypothetical protein
MSLYIEEATMPGMHWSIEEQTIDLAPLTGGDVPHVASLRFWVEPTDTAIKHLGILLEDGSALNITFQRNGPVTGHTLVPATPPEGTTTSTEPKSGKSKSKHSDEVI